MPGYRSGERNAGDAVLENCPRRGQFVPVPALFLPTGPLIFLAFSGLATGSSPPFRTFQLLNAIEFLSACYCSLA